MSLRCPEFHESTEPDYCSVCGVAMGPPGSSKPANAPATLGHVTACPACGEPRPLAETRFCEVCRYDFQGRKGGKRAAAVPAGYVLVVQVDPTLDIEPDPATPPPTGVSDVRIPVAAAELLVGRKDDVRDVHPDIPVADPGSSRRHAKFVRGTDGSLALHDLASMNGTKLNGVDVVAGSRTQLHVGDEVTLGRWTRIKVEGPL
jgi:hypothetical protein